MTPETPNLLITDDDPALRSTVSEALSRRGFSTLEAADGQEALDLIRERHVHLVLVDNHMPRLTGLQLLSRLYEANMKLPCILMTADLDDRIEAEARRLRALEVLAKPLRLRSLATHVRDALRRSYGWDVGLPDHSH